jgi:hypothetical protein
VVARQLPRTGGGCLAFCLTARVRTVDGISVTTAQSRAGCDALLFQVAVLAAHSRSCLTLSGVNRIFSAACNSQGSRSFT